MIQTVRLANEKAIQLLGMKKIFKANPGQPLILTINEGDGKQVIPLLSEDGIEEFSLEIQRSRKILAKITFHHMEKTFKQCLFRLDLNGAPHTNPSVCNEFVPEVLKKFQGKDVGRSHMHQYVEGYGPELTWAMPVKDTAFSRFPNLNDIEPVMQGIVDTVCEVINLSEKIVYNQLLSYG